MTKDFTHGIDVRFDGESGVGDGVRREYLRLYASEFVDPMRNLLVCMSTEGAHAHRLQPSSSSGVNPDHLSYFEMLGKLSSREWSHVKMVQSRDSIVPFSPLRCRSSGQAAPR